MTKVHLDTDLAGDTDDLCALAYLLARPDVELVGVTTCCEAAGRRAGYARYALHLAGRPEVPVAAGSEGSLGGYVGEAAATGPGLPEERDFWPEPVAPAPGGAGEALSLLERSVAAGATVVGIGTYTNLAMLEAARPGLLAATRVVLMGGYTRPPGPGLPTWGPDVDWNVQQDAVAARILWQRCRPALVPLDVTLGTFIREADLPRLRRAGGLAALLAHQAAAHAALYGMTQLGRNHAALPDDLLNFHYDPLACAVALGWEGATIEVLPVRVETQDGWLVPRVDPAGRDMPVVTAVDGERFNRHWLDTVAS